MDMIRRQNIKLFFIRLGIISFALNFAWELAQCRYFIHVSNPPTYGDMAKASAGDVMMVFVIFVGVSLVVGGMNWVFMKWNRKVFGLLLLISITVAVAVEIWGLSQKRWLYQSDNLLMPGMNLSLFPLLQMPILTAISLKLAALLGRRNREKAYIH